MTWGKEVAFLQKRFDAGKPTPALENKPDVFQDLEDVWELFWQLHRCRQNGMGPSPLSVTDIVALFDICDISKVERLDTFELIKAMDVDWLAWANEQVKS